MKREDRYTIQEYDSTTGVYTTIGEQAASSSEVAKLRFVERTKWKPERNKCLFVKIPICR
tara:strand:- start:42 stop:221 length:180 start_codon:yes stop_codon:yes gene_type:complete